MQTMMLAILRRGIVYMTDYYYRYVIIMILVQTQDCVENKIRFSL